MVGYRLIQMCYANITGQNRRYLSKVLKKLLGIINSNKLKAKIKNVYNFQLNSVKKYT